MLVASAGFGGICSNERCIEMAGVAMLQSQFDCSIGQKMTRPKKGSSENYHFLTLVGMGWAHQVMVGKDIFTIAPGEGEKCTVIARVCPIKAKVKRGATEMEADVLEFDVVSVGPRNPGTGK